MSKLNRREFLAASTAAALASPAAGQSTVAPGDRLGVGLIGCISIVPLLNDATVGFGLLEIIWLGWLGTILLRTNETSGSDRLPTSAGAPLGSGERTRR